MVSKKKSLETFLIVALSLAFWMTMVTVFTQVYIYVFVFCVFLGLLLVIDNAEAIDRYLFVRLLSKSSVKDLKKEKKPLWRWWIIGVESYIVVGLISVMMPFWFFLQAKKLVSR